MMDAGRTAIGVCFAIVALSAIWDLASQKIPNILTLGGIAIAFALRVSVGYTDAGFRGALHGAGWVAVGLFACGILPMISYLQGELGGGDVKLFAVIGAFCGPALGYSAIAWTCAVVMFAVVPVRLLRRGLLRQSMKSWWIGLTNYFKPKESRVTLALSKLPPLVLGPSIFAGTLVAFTLHGVFR